MNRGGVTGKRDYAGGVVGLMDLGRVSGCENYGDIASTDGGYVGGIAGASWGTIRDSWVKCHLSGGDYIGGVAGPVSYTHLDVYKRQACDLPVAGNRLSCAVRKGGSLHGCEPRQLLF